MMMISNFCKKHGLIERGDKILCAVSGGADSMAMLAILLEMAEKAEIEICVAHLNHGIRGVEADSDERFVMEYCEKFNIIYRTEKVNVPEFANNNSMGIEETARVLRYEFLEKTAKELNCNKIATAHNARDNVETVLMNFCRGSGLRGLCGIAPMRGNIIRPILCLDRPEIEAYLAENAIEYVTDFTNLDTKYTRNSLRHGTVKELEAHNADFASKFLSATELLREDERFLDELAENYLKENPEISASDLAKQAYSIASRVILKKAPRATSRQVAEILSMLKSEKTHATIDITACRVTKSYDALFFGKKCRKSVEELAIYRNEAYNWGKYEIFSKIEVLNTEKYLDKANLCFKSDLVCGKIMVTGRKTGDTLRLSRRKLTKTLKKLYAEACIESSEREFLPVFRDDKGVLGVFSFGVDERVEAKIGDLAIIVNIKKQAEEENRND